MLQVTTHGLLLDNFVCAQGSETRYMGKQGGEYGEAEREAHNKVKKGMKARRSIWNTSPLRSSRDSTSIKHPPAEFQKKTVIPLPSPAKDPCYSNVTILVNGVEKVLIPPAVPPRPQLT